jgi:hypothetical protein
MAGFEVITYGRFWVTAKGLLWKATAGGLVVWWSPLWPSLGDRTADLIGFFADRHQDRACDRLLRGRAVALASHCGARADDESLELEMGRSHWTATTWRECLGAGEIESRLAAIRQRTHTGRPLGTAEFIQSLEKATQRRLTLQKRGPHEKIVTDRRQGELTFDP